MNSKVLLYANTIKRMKPSMVLSRLRKNHMVSLSEDVPAVSPMSLSSFNLDFDPSFISRFDVDALREDEFLLINERHRVDLSKWTCPEASHLWNFNLHYFEFCVPLAVRFKKLGDSNDLRLLQELMESWIDGNPYPDGDGWHPYTISLRLVNWLICLDIIGGLSRLQKKFVKKLNESMFLQYRHLMTNQETHLLANHYWENLKTLAIMSLYFNDEKRFAAIEGKLLAQLDEQILADGVHFERSMMYHKIVLEGMVRLGLAYRSAGKIFPKEIMLKAKLMLDAMESIEKGMGKTPFFNDSADGVAKNHDALVGACKSAFSLQPDDSKMSFPSAGFYKLYTSNASVAFFCGSPGPGYMLGHAHCDLLSYELSIAGRPVAVNSGTYAYQSALRSYYRSSAAHNTCQANNDEQMECWGEHRVARGIACSMVEAVSSDSITAYFEDYRGNRYRRTIVLKEGEMSVEDSVIGNEGLSLTSRLHFAPNADENVNVISPYEIHCFPYDYSPEFGKLEAAQGLAFASSSGRVAYTIKWDSKKKENC